MNTTIKLRCIDQVLTLEDTPLIASGGVQEDFISVEFCSKWAGLTKTAVFWRSEDEPYHVLLDKNDTCVIPPEVLTEEGRFYFGLFGVSSDGKQRTSEVMRYTVSKGAITSGTKPSDPTPDIYTQILAKYQDVLEKKLTAADVGAAPAGYGYCEPMPTITAETNADITASLDVYLNELKENESMQIHLSGGSNTITVGTRYYGVLVKATNDYATFRMGGYAHKGASVQIIKIGGTWGEFEWLNPPMQLGVEYRTTERYRGKHVWTVLVKLGSFGAGENNVLTDFSATAMLRLSATAGSSALPLLLVPADQAGYMRAVNGGLTTDGKLRFSVINGTYNTTETQFLVQAWYTKD